MPKKINKKTSNLIIAIGYCLVAVIILFNYLGGSRSNRINLIAEKYRKTPIQNESVDFLKKQLSEEKRVNKEMRDILRSCQDALNKPGAKAKPTTIATPYKLNDPLPSLKTDHLHIGVKSKFPFKKGRNPFLPLKNKIVITPSKNNDALGSCCFKSDPTLPFFITGTGMDIKLSGNF